MEHKEFWTKSARALFRRPYVVERSTTLWRSNEDDVITGGKGIDSTGTVRLWGPVLQAMGSPKPWPARMLKCCPQHCCEAALHDGVR